MKGIANLLNQGRFTEAQQMNIRFTGIIGLWDLQGKNIKDAATKDASASQRSEWTTKNQIIC